jgi:hypothetical protein
VSSPRPICGDASKLVWSPDIGGHHGAPTAISTTALGFRSGKVILARCDSLCRDRWLPQGIRIFRSFVTQH